MYVAAHNNALKLLEEAELLLENNSFARAFMLAFSGLEEIAKSQLAADVYTGYITEADFKSHFTDHKKKIGRVLWATLDANEHSLYTEEELEALHPKFKDRSAALYCDFSNGKVTSPDDVITKDDATRIIMTLETAITRIVEVEHSQGIMGTKGFMK